MHYSFVVVFLETHILINLAINLHTFTIKPQYYKMSHINASCFIFSWLWSYNCCWTVCSRDALIHFYSVLIPIPDFGYLPIPIVIPFCLMHAGRRSRPLWVWTGRCEWVQHWHLLSITPRFYIIVCKSSENGVVMFSTSQLVLRIETYWTMNSKDI